MILLMDSAEELESAEVRVSAEVEFLRIMFLRIIVNRVFCNLVRICMSFIRKL